MAWVEQRQLAFNGLGAVANAHGPLRNPGVHDCGQLEEGGVGLPKFPQDFLLLIAKSLPGNWVTWL